MGAVKERGGMGKGASLPQDNPKPALLPPPENTNRFPIKSLRYVASEYKNDYFCASPEGLNLLEK